MSPVFAIATNITTSLGLDTATVWNEVISGQTGIRRQDDPALSPTPFWASRINESGWEAIRQATEAWEHLTLFERMALHAAQQALAQCPILNLSNTVFILATTKGNIEDLSAVPDERNALSTSAKLIAKCLDIPAKPVVISHACVSGVSALLYGMRVIQAGRFEHAIVVGADRFTRFVLSGFQSFQAIANEPCRPFDAARNGINLGEAASAIILSNQPGNAPLAKLCGGSTSNDANHISGPSRTGQELSMAIGRAIAEADIKPNAIGAISAHGTATLYNDEMEAKAFTHAGLAHAEVHSMKGYVGHTLGAAGVLESAMAIESLRHQRLIPSAGFTELGVSEPLHITVKSTQASLDYILKTASGFGGCNAVAIWGKV